MALIPSVKVTTGATLQRSYFTSELFVTAAREDVERLLSTFDHLVEDEVTPFTIFKQAWIKEGWNYAHLYIWEATARREYFLTMFRIFLGEWQRLTSTKTNNSIEHMNEEEDEVLQIGAVFALYTLYEMQMKSEALQRVEHIPICIGEYTLIYLPLLKCLFRYTRVPMLSGSELRYDIQAVSRSHPTTTHEQGRLSYPTLIPSKAV